MNARICILCAAILGAMGVAMGAYQSHGLGKMLLKTQNLDAEILAKRVAICGDGVRYQIYHALALLGIGAALFYHPNRMLSAAAVILLLGTVVFSGALYAIVFVNENRFGMVAPVGGVLLIMGWLTIAIAAMWSPP